MILKSTNKTAGSMSVRSVFAALFVAFTVVSAVHSLISGSRLAAALTAFAGLLGGFTLYRYSREHEATAQVAERRRYQNLLVRAAAGMGGERNLDRLLQLIVRMVVRAVRVEFAALYLEDEESAGYRLRAYRDRESRPADGLLPSGHPLIAWMREWKAPLTAREIRSSTAGLCRKDAELLVPSLVGDHLQGFLVLGPKRDGRAFVEDDVELFKILSYHAFLAIEHCRLEEAFAREHEQLLSSGKLASLGGMAGGIAHQIKNRLNLFSIAAFEQRYEIDDFLKENAHLVAGNPALRKTLDYLKQTSDSLVDNVKRAADTVQGISDFARPGRKEAPPSELLLSDILAPVREVLCARHRLSAFPLETELPAPGTVFGVREQLVELLFILLDNAFEACWTNLQQKGLKGAVIRLKLARTDSRAVIEITDNGSGVRDEDLPRLFRPFFTTKPSSGPARGLGLLTARRIVETGHGGSLTLSSEYGKGTAVRVELPLKQTQA